MTRIENLDTDTMIICIIYIYFCTRIEVQYEAAKFSSRNIVTYTFV